MVAAANPLAARAGLDILRAGGSAVDAAVAVQAVLTLVEPQSSGIGGGAFMLHYAKADGVVDAYDGRETAPAGISPDAFLRPDGTRRDFRDAARGGRAVGVPGVLRMLALAHRKYGKLPWARLFDRAIALSENGFRVSPRMHKMVSRAKGLRDFPAARAYFLTADGTAKPVGTLLRNPALAQTFRVIAAEGADAFYTGRIAADIARAVRHAKTNPGTMTTDDLAGYRAVRRSALCRPYRDWRVCGMPPPTSGGLGVLQILGILDRFDMARLPPSSPLAIHLFAEAARLAYADRGLYVGDPAFVRVPVDGLLDPGYLEARSELISTTAAMKTVSPGRPPSFPASFPKHALMDGGDASWPCTSHFSIIDDDGNAVSMTTSVERAFGSHLMVDGFLLNNQLTDFAFRPRRDGRTVANAVAPGKRPRSTMSPTLVFDRDGGLHAAVGSPGGYFIIPYVAKTLVGLLDRGLDMQDAIDLPNVAVRGKRIYLEKGTDAAKQADALRRLGHEVRIIPMTSGLHGILVTGHGYDGGADPRREGVALGD